MSDAKLKNEFARFAMHAKGHSVWWDDDDHQGWSFVEYKHSLPVRGEQVLFGFRLNGINEVNPADLQKFAGLFGELEYFEFVDIDFNDHDVAPLSGLKELGFAKFSNCVLSVDVIEALTAATKLQFLVLAGCSIDESLLSALQQLSQVRCIIFADANVDLPSLERARKHMDSVVLSYRKNDNRVMQSELPAVELPYQFEMEAGDQIQDSMNEIKEILAQRGLTKSHKFGDPVSEEELVALENQIGLKLPFDIRSLLELSNGQSEFDSLVCLAPFIGTNGIARRFDFHLEFGISEFYFTAYLDQAGDWHRLGIPIMGADALTVFVDPLTGQVFYYDVPDGMVLTKDLRGLIANLERKVRQQLIDDGAEDLSLYIHDLATDGESSRFG